MKIFKRKLMVMTAGLTFFCSGLAISQAGLDPGTATNCSYTGNSADYCYASDGSNNLKVINCRPGSTSCYY